MSNWKIGVVLLVVTVASHAGDALRQPVYINGGEPMRLSSPSLGVSLSFDGEDKLTIQKYDTRMVLSARVPSIVAFSPKALSAVLNFGDGSGQVYDIEVINLGSAQNIDISNFRDAMRQYAKQKGCTADLNSFSVLFKRWITEEEMELTTEDFSRIAGCSMMNRSWKINVGRSK